MTGTGTALDPYIILTRADLEAVDSDMTAYYELGADIDLAGTDWVPARWDETGLWCDTPFVGQFDGKGHKINHLTIDFTGRSSSDYIYEYGLFGWVEGTIKNVILCNASFDSGVAETDSCGLLVGLASDCIIEDCSVVGTMRLGNNCHWFNGGLVADADSSCQILRCRADITLTVDTHGSETYNGEICEFGAIAGWLTGQSTVEDCTGILKIRGSIGPKPLYPGYMGWGEIYDVGAIGGYVDTRGQGSPLTISNCKGIVDIDLTVDDYGQAWDIGGLVGLFQTQSAQVGYLEDCSTSGKIKLSSPIDNPQGYFCADIGGLGGQIKGDPAYSIYPEGPMYINRCFSSVDIEIEGGQWYKYGLGDEDWDGNTQIGAFSGYDTFFIDRDCPTYYADCGSIGDINIHTAAAHSGAHEIGMLLGTAVTMQNCYYAGVITLPADVAQFYGIFGYTTTTYPTVTSVYWDTQVSGVATSERGVGKTTSEMQTQSTFTGWDFSTVWNIASGTYPFLRTAFVTLTDGCAVAGVVKSFPWAAKGIRLCKVKEAV